MSKQFKYAIKERLENLPIKHYRRMRILIPKALNKTLKTFDRYCNLTMNEYGDIPAIDLDIIASCLGCSSDDLKNYKIQKHQTTLAMKVSLKSKPSNSNNQHD